ncbi:MAG: ABC transporter permease [Bacteroidales bacterium]
MFTSFFKVALRVLWRQKGYTFINITGLAIGLGSAILILLYVLGEKHYDTFHTNANNIYRIYLDGKIGEDRLRGAWTCAPLGPTLKKDFPEVVDAVRIQETGNTLIKIDDKSFIENNILYADSGFFTMFTFPLLKGDPKKVLTEPNTVVLTKTTASRMFGDADPVGKLIRFETDTTYYRITGVAQDPPVNSQFRFNMIVTFRSIKYYNLTMWLSNSFYTYVQLQNGFPAKQLEDKFPDMLKKYAGPEIKSIMGIELEEWLSAGNQYGYKLQPLLDVHLDNSVEGGIVPAVNKRYLVIFSLIAAFIIVMACINYMNMATARSATRAREVGIRKVAGSDRKTLIFQFLTESVIITFMALILAVILVDLVTPWFNNTMNLSISLNLFGGSLMWAVLLTAAVVIGILAGIYPSFLLSTYSPAKVLKSGFSQGKGNSSLRRILVTLQFVISVAILCGTVVIYQQLKYLQTKDLGFNRENLLVIERGGSLRENQKVFTEEVKKFPGVTNVCISTAIPGRLNNYNGYGMEGKEANKTYLMQTFWTDDKFAETYQLKLTEGRFLSSDFASDSSAAVINEVAKRQFGIEDISKTRFILPAFEGSFKFLQVVGVVNDFNIESLRSEIKPSIFMLRPKDWNWGYISIRLKPSDIQNSISQIENLWNKLTSNEPFQYFFLDDELNKQYQEEKRTGNLALFFTILAISIACLGLLGLVSYTITRRTKEIGVRKIMGSDPWSIVLLLSSETITLIAVASLIAWPLAWFYLKNWLTDFAYRIHLNPLVFILTTFLVILISIGTILWQTYRAALRNPAEALRYE